MLKEKVDELIKKDKKGNNKIENLIVFLIILVITVITINTIWNKDKNTPEEVNNTNKRLADYNNSNLNEETYDSNSLEQNLEAILSSINGVGKTKVFINYSESSTVEAMYNETKKESSTEETDNSGGVRTIQQTDTQKDIIYSEDSGNKAPVTQKITNPTIEGAIITAEGAENSDVKSNIISAVSSATGLATHKIQVFKMNN